MTVGVEHLRQNDRIPPQNDYANALPSSSLQTDRIAYQEGLAFAD